MSDPLLDPNQSPSEFRPDAGVRRLNKLPLLALAAVLLVVLLVFVMAVNDRGKAPDRQSLAVAPIEQPEVQIPDGQRGYDAVVAGFEDAIEIEAAPVEEPQATVVERVVEVVQPTPQPTVADQAIEQAKQHQFDLFRDAVAAETSVPVDIYDRSVEGAPAEDPFAVLDQLSSVGDRRVDDLIAQATGGLADPNLRDRKDAFATSQADFGYSTARPRAPLSRYELNVGSIIPAVLITEINSDLPGLIKAQVSKPVWDTRTGDVVVVPRGSTLIGRYDNVVARGQQRVMIAWDRLQFPSGSTLNLGNMPGVDAVGAAGVNDQVDNHYWRTFGNATLLSLISAAAQQSQPDGSVTGNAYSVSSQEQLAAELGRNWSAIGQQVVQQNMQIQPTLIVRPGFRFNVMVNRDLILGSTGALNQ